MWGCPQFLGRQSPQKMRSVLALIWTCASHCVSNALGHCRLVRAVHKLVSSVADVVAACAKATDA